jgi:hypothetical protein
VRIYIEMAYTVQLSEPPENEWGNIAPTLSSKMGVRPATIIAVFKKCQSGKPNPEKQKPGAGCIAKLTADNKGRVAAALVIITGGLVQQATNMCNWQNAADSFDVTVTRNTLMNSLRRFADVDISTVDCRKTGSKDPNGAWAVARSVFAAQMASQYAYGEQIDKIEAVFDCCLPPPLWVDRTLWAN